jgi:hypothetical protein
VAEKPLLPGSRLVLSDFGTTPEYVAPGARWLGFSDRVMGGVSDARVALAEVAGRRGLRLTGRVTRDNGGGFIQVALDLAPRGGVLDASGYDGFEFWVHGNDEDYNVHLRTPDCRWYDQSYRHSFRAAARWQAVRVPWTAFAPNDVPAPLATARLQRFAVLGWMREFVADVTLGSVALYVG